MKQGALPQEAMFKNNIFMKYYKKMQYPFGKEKKLTTQPSPSPLPNFHL
jgi:hypothetical protein